jgi:hypothetical protein
MLKLDEYIAFKGHKDTQQYQRNCKWDYIFHIANQAFQAGWLVPTKTGIVIHDVSHLHN